MKFALIGQDIPALLPGLLADLLFAGRQGAEVYVEEKNAAMQEVERTGNLPIPTHLQDAHYKGAAKLGHGTGYKYAHNYPNHYVEQQYLPYELSGREFYQPSGNGYEVKIREHMKRIREEARIQENADQNS